MCSLASAQGHLLIPLPAVPSLQRSVSDNTLVAMDFSGHAGRVIENPREALSAALEEAQAWRVRSCNPASGPERGLMWCEGKWRVPGKTSKHTLTPTHPRLCRERRTIASACPPRAPARASVQVGDIWGPQGGGCLSFPEHSCQITVCLPSSQPSTAPSPGSTDAFPERRASGSLGSRAWWTGKGQGRAGTGPG